MVNVSIGREDFLSTRDLRNAFLALKVPTIYVGIPEDTATRRSGKINNAQLLFIHTNGSPLHRIPRRPVIEPALMAPETRKAITEGFKQIALTSLDAAAAAPTLPQTALHPIRHDHPRSLQLHAQVMRRMRLLGVLGAKAAKGWFTDPRNGWPPLKEATIRAKLEKLKGRRKKAALAAFERGEDKYTFGDATYNISTPLIDTGAMRQAITWVIREKAGSLVTGSAPNPGSIRTMGATVDNSAADLEGLSLVSLREGAEKSIKE